MSNQSSRSCPELDRENAHFSVSEAMIAAIEEVKFKTLFSNIFLIKIYDCICRPDSMNGDGEKKKKMMNSLLEVMPMMRVTKKYAKSKEIYNLKPTITVQPLMVVCLENQNNEYLIKLISLFLCSSQHFSCF